MFCYLFCDKSREKFLDAYLESNIKFDPQDWENKLILVLKMGVNNNFGKNNSKLLDDIKLKFKQLLPFNDQEKLFINAIIKDGNIHPKWITSDEEMAIKIQSHPALLWSAQKARKIVA